VPHEDIHYLTRDEIVGFGIDSRDAPEAQWIAAEMLPQKIWAMKFFVEARGEGHSELRSNMIRLECASQREARLDYFRGLGSEERPARRNVELATPERKLPLFGGLRFKVDAIEQGTSFELWSAELPLDFLETAGKQDHVEIVETDSARATPRVSRLSTVGLAQAIGTLRGRCGVVPDCPQTNVATAASTAGAPQNGRGGAILPKPGAAAPSRNCAPTAAH